MISSVSLVSHHATQSYIDLHCYLPFVFNVQFTDGILGKLQKNGIATNSCVLDIEHTTADTSTHQMFLQRGPESNQEAAYSIDILRRLQSEENREFVSFSDDDETLSGIVRNFQVILDSACKNPCKVWQCGESLASPRNNNKVDWKSRVQHFRQEFRGPYLVINPTSK
jgi:hypothetical protein